MEPQEIVPTRRIWADWEEKGIYVYQAFRPETVQYAAAHGTFGVGFSLERMTWIKPSFGWMLYRSGYATKHRQEAIARICLSHVGFMAILEQSVQTMYDPNVFSTEREWASALSQGEVRHQWDPDRDGNGAKNGRRAIQIGIRGETVRRYVGEWIQGIEDATALAHATRYSDLPAAPSEREYKVGTEFAHRLGFD